MINRIIGFFLVLITAFSGLFSVYSPGSEIEFRAEYPAGERDMAKYRGIYTYVDNLGGVPSLFVNGEPFPAAAYMTYLEEYNNYDLFAGCGYNLFSVPVLFSGRWISSTELFKPFHGGIFDDKTAPDFSSLDSSIERILAACPDAYIFPRVNMSMPLWWIEENLGCTDGTGVRESLFSSEYRETAADMLRRVIRHINGSAYASHIAGYQLAGGNTEEWFHFDMNAGCCENAEDEFNAYLKKHYPDCGFSGLPDLPLLKGKGTYHKDEHLARYLEFASNAVADDICYFSSVAKEETGRNLVVGTFYGYSLEVTVPLHGTHSLRTLLDCDDIDFICSPNSYIGTRNMDYDWTEMYPADSVRLHGKLCMQECDIRTHLTKLLSEAAPEYDEGGNLNAEVWHPLENKEQSVSMIRKSFSRQLIRGNGFWWFDMWGGWYNDPGIISDMGSMRDILSASLSREDRASKAETAVFADESMYKYVTDCSLRNAAHYMRAQLGFMGTPYDIYDVSDFEAVYGRYKAIIFLSELKTQSMKRALEICKEKKIKYISVSGSKKEYSAKELRAYCESRGVHIYCDSDDVFYIGGGYFALHSGEGGVRAVRFERDVSFRELLSDDPLTGRGKTAEITLKPNETKLFEIIQ